MNKRLVVLFVSLFSLASLASVMGGCATSSANAPATPATLSKGRVLAQRLVHSLGGASALDALQTISFEWVMRAGGFELSRHRHDWDRVRNLHRYRSGDIDVTYVLGGDGITMENGVEVTEEKRHRELLQEAFQWWTNDTYWLLSPHKVLDEGTVAVAVDGDGDGDTDELRITFGEVGLIPGDTYIYYLDDNGAPTGFRFILESGLTGDATFIDEVTLHDVSFHLRKIAGPTEIRFENLEVSRGPRDAIFASLLSRNAESTTTDAVANKVPVPAAPVPAAPAGASSQPAPL